jgi:hypothetical protein
MFLLSSPAERSSLEVPVFGYLTLNAPSSQGDQILVQGRHVRDRAHAGRQVGQMIADFGLPNRIEQWQ